MSSLELCVAWAEGLQAGEVHAVSVDVRERSSGLAYQIYWLLLLTGPAFQAPEDTTHSTDHFEEGWWVVPGKWLDLVQVSERAHAQLPDEVLVNVNSMLRLEGGVKMTIKRKLCCVSEEEHNRAEAAG